MNLGFTDLSTDVTISIATNFFKDMGQPFQMPAELMYDSHKIEKIQREANEH